MPHDMDASKKIVLGLFGFVWVRFGFSTGDIGPKLGSFG
jgi:hypothetical protein